MNQGKPFYSVISTAGASLVHWVLCPVLAIKYDMKMTGVAIASSVHFVCRFLIILVCAKMDPHLNRSFIPIFHPDSFKDLGYVLEIGWQSFLVKVMGWWAFDVFT